MGKPPEMRQKILIGFRHKEQGTNLLAAVGNSYPLLPNQWTFGNISMVSMAVVSKLGVNGSAEKIRSVNTAGITSIMQLPTNFILIFHSIIIIRDINFKILPLGEKISFLYVAMAEISFLGGVLEGICIGNYFGFEFHCLF